MSGVWTFICIGLGGGAGALARVLLGQRLNATIAVGTLAANTLASFCLAVLWEWQGFAQWGIAADWKHSASLGLQVGLLGALSTWSSLAHEVAGHLRARRPQEARLALGLNLALGILAAWLGLQLGAAL